MSMELHVFFRGPLPRKAAVARTAKALGFPLSIPADKQSLEGHSGYLPMRLRRETTGVEFDVFDGRNNIEEIANGLAIDPAFDRTASFRWGGDETEMLCALCAAAALAQLVGGVVLGDDEDRPLPPDDAIGMARDYLASIAKPETPADRRGTRPADIKRYLKSLLKLRGDLVLAGRHLLIKPVRHVLRGAFFDRTGDKYSFRTRWYAQPLYADSGRAVGCGDYIGVNECPVWEPHFEPLVMDALANDVFARVGPLTTLRHFADAVDAADNWRTRESTRVKALVLAGERERAADYVRECERRGFTNPYWKDWLEQQWALLARDIEDICAEARAKEAETVRAMKLEALWEPSPFPAELPAQERAGRTAEPVFPTIPWIATPPWLLQEAPEQPGDIRFAKSVIRRADRLILLVPLSREEAEVRHHGGEPYVLFVREPDGVLVHLDRQGSDRNDPRYFGPLRVGAMPLHLALYGVDHRITVFLLPAGPDERMLYLSLVSVTDRVSGESIWDCSVQAGNEGEEDDHGADGDPNIEVEIIDRRGPAPCSINRRALTTADRENVVCSIPAFGEVYDLATRVRAWLRNAGFGEIA